jgi:hypothetical protein
VVNNFKAKHRLSVLGNRVLGCYRGGFDCAVHWIVNCLCIVSDVCNALYSCAWWAVMTYWWNHTSFTKLLVKNSQCLTTGWTIGRSRFDPRQGQRIFLLATASRPALGLTQPPIQWVPRVLSQGVKRGRGVTLTTHPHLVPRLRMSRSYTSSPPMCVHGV